MSKLSQSLKDYLKELVCRLKIDKDLGELDAVDVNDPKSIQKILDKYQVHSCTMPTGLTKL